MNRVGAGRGAEVLALDRDRLSHAALRRRETENGKPAGRGCRARDRKKIPDRVVVVGGHIPAWIHDCRQSSQRVINILDRSAALRPERRHETENEQEDQPSQHSLPHHRSLHKSLLNQWLGCGRASRICYTPYIPQGAALPPKSTEWVCR